MRASRSIATAALGFLSLSAIYGGGTLIAEAQGNPWGFLPQSLLRHSPFHSYLIPGIVLLLANGLLPLYVLWILLKQGPNGGIWTAFQGSLLLGWLMVQCLMLRILIWPHYLYGANAVVLIVCGALLWRDANHLPSRT